MSISSELKYKLKKVQYPIEIVDYNSAIQRMEAETRKLQNQYTQPIEEMQEYCECQWYKKHKDLILKYIREGKLAPIDAMDGLDEEPSCIVCMASLGNKASGFNLIQCSNNSENHLICTRCILDTLTENDAKENIPENQQLDIVGLKIWCQCCKKLSPIVFYPPSRDEIIKQCKESGEELPSTLIYQRFNY